MLEHIDVLMDDGVHVRDILSYNTFGSYKGMLTL